MWLLLAPDRGLRPARRAAAAVLTAALAWAVLGWTRSVTPYPDAFPLALTPLRVLLLAAAGLLLGTAAFAAAGGRGDAGRGAAFGLALGAIGTLASRWPQLARAIELCGGIFAGPFLAAALPLALAATAAAVAAALLLRELNPHARALTLAAAVLWAVPTLGVEAALTRWWGYGPRSLAEAAGVPTNRDSGTVEVLRLAPSRWSATPRESVRMADGTTDASPRTLETIESFLRRARYRDVFAREGLGVVRRGWERWWFAERALDAAMIAVPGRVHPDYLEALDLLKAGPLTAQRYAKLQRLDGEATASPAGLESVSGAQKVFEGFIAAYARFGDSAKAQRWLERADGLRWVSDRPLEVATLEGFRGGRVTGRLTESGIPPQDVMTGLFLLWTSSATHVTEPLLADAVFPDARGEFEFSNLGPGDYELALMGPADSLSGALYGNPGVLTIDAAHPARGPFDLRLVRRPVAPPFAPDTPPPHVPPPGADDGPPVRWPGR